MSGGVQVEQTLIPWGAQGQADGAWLVGAILGADLGTLPPEEFRALRLPMRAGALADFAFWCLFGAEQLWHALVVSRDPRMVTAFYSERTPKVGGRVLELRGRYGAAVVDAAPADLMTLYLGTQGICRELYQRSRPSREAPVFAPPAPVLPGPGLVAERTAKRLRRASLRGLGGGVEDEQLGALPMVAVVALSVVGVAAVLGGSWAIGKDREAKREAEAVAAVAAARASVLADAARAKIAVGQEVDLEQLAGVDFADLLRGYAAKEAAGSWAPWAVGGAVAAGVGALALVRS